ncbi:MAG: acyl carrier protein [Deltaproteobacteria bacterium]|nr:acyl carrier protein [Deltaproteobacteria bacterium]
MSNDQIKTTIREFIVKEFLPGEDPEDLDASVRLVSDGILTSLASLRLVAFLEERFGVTLEAHEVDADHLDNIDDITALVAERSR